MKIGINCSMTNGSLEEKIVSYKEAGFDSIEINVASTCDKPCVREENASNIKSMMNNIGLTVANAYKLHGWFELDGSLMNVNNNWTEIKQECKRRMLLAKSIGASTIICCPAYSNRGHHASLNEGASRFREILSLGKEVDVEPVFEYMGQTEQINTLTKTLDFMDIVNEKFRLVVDVYHMWRGGGSLTDINLLKPEQISIVHLSDADVSINREQHRDLQRPMPGDGFLDLSQFMKNLDKIGYHGDFSVGSYKGVTSDRSIKSIAIEAFTKTKKIIDEK